jgi:hypothetical protein
MFRNERYFLRGMQGTYVVLPAFAVFLQQSHSNRRNTGVVREVTRIISKEIDKSVENVFISIQMKDPFTYSSATLSILDDCHRCLRSSMSSKNLGRNDEDGK